VTIEEPQHVAMPKLYGAPAYARPPHHAEDVARPFDPDELPIEAERTDEEHEFVSTLPSRAWAPGGIQLDTGEANTTDANQSKGFSLRAVAGRLLGGS
jgi:hypothetical protein